MKVTVRTTIVYAMVSAVLVWPVTGVLAGLLGWETAFKLALWASLSGYALLLLRWSDKRTAAPLFPLALLLGLALWPGTRGAFFFMLVGGLAWIRSGICFDRVSIRALIAEAITIPGGAGLVTAVNPGTAVTWSLCIWLFILIQSLYFFIVPVPSAKRDSIPSEDPFVRASRNARRILDS